MDRLVDCDTVVESDTDVVVRDVLCETVVERLVLWLTVVLRLVLCEIVVDRLVETEVVVSDVDREIVVLRLVL